MGAEFNDVSFKEENKDKVRKLWANEVKNAEYENGHAGNYTGSIAELGTSIDFTNVLVGDYETAEEYLSDNHRKWDCALAVQYVINSTVKSNARDKLKEKEQKAYTDWQTLEKKLTSEISNAKSKTISCKRCDSKVNRSYVKTHWCPVCASDLLSPTAKARLVKAKEKYTIAKSTQENYTPKIAKGSKKAWLVGGWCSS